MDFGPLACSLAITNKNSVICFGIKILNRLPILLSYFFFSQSTQNHEGLPEKPQIDSVIGVSRFDLAANLLHKHFSASPLAPL